MIVKASYADLWAIYQKYRPWFEKAERAAMSGSGGGSGRAKMQKTMGEFKAGNLRSGSKKGPKVTSRKQAVAIAMKQAGKSKKEDVG